MRYLGGKARIAKKLLPVLQAFRDDRPWIEPFIGGANLFHLVPGRKVGADTHPYLIALLQAVRDGWEPPRVVTREEYTHIRDNRDLYRPELVGFVGFCCSFGGMWFSSYATDTRGDDYAGNGRNSLLKQARGLQGADILCCDYRDVPITEPSFIYCDPPYASTAGYSTGGFSHAEFWDWCRARVANGHTVAVSEYAAPDDWPCVAPQQLPDAEQRGQVRHATSRAAVPSDG